jgi:dsRNA-specific ribonuclease
LFLGTGKTLIAKLLIDHMFSTIDDLIIFLAPTVVLCKQQHQFLQTHGNYSLGIFHGELGIDLWDISKWKQEYSKAQIFVMTPQTFLDNLHFAVLSMNQVGLIVFDECHHAKKDHPYNKIMTEFYRHSLKKPKILGLTASPVSTGVSKSNSSFKQSQLLQQLSENLNSKIITPSKISMSHSLASQPQEILEYYPPSSSCYITALEKVLEHRDCPPLTENDKRLFSQNSLRAVINSLGSWAAAHLVHGLLIELQRIPLSYRLIYPLLGEHLSYLQHLHHHWSSLALQSSPLGSHDISNQAIRLIEILTNHFQSSPHDQQLCVIIFVQTRYTARCLTRLLNSLSSSSLFLKRDSSTSSERCPHCQSQSATLGRAQEEFTLRQIRADYLVSKNSGSGGGGPGGSEPTKNNSMTLDQFRKGKLQILVATSIAEEGLDVQSCQLVVRYQEIQTVSSYVQSRGRARHISSKYIVLEGREQQQLQGSSTVNFNSVRECEKLMRVELSKSLSGPRPSTLSSTPLRSDDTYRVSSTGALVSLSSAITLIYQYCDTLTREKYATSAPRYLSLLETQDKFLQHIYCFDLYLPSQCPIEVVHGSNRRAKLLAKQQVSLLACQRLHEAGLLNDHLCPIRQDKSPSLDDSASMILPLPSRQLHTITSNCLLSWAEVEETEGSSYHLYSLKTTDESMTVPFLVLTTIQLSTTLEFEMPLSDSTKQSRSVGESGREAIITLLFQHKGVKHFSFESLKTLQSSFGTLMANFVSPTYRPSLRRDSTHLSPILIMFHDHARGSLSFTHPFYEKFSFLIWSIEQALTRQLCQLTLQVYFKNKTRTSSGVSLFETALTAPLTQHSCDYNRLETLGDSALKLIISMSLFDKFPSHSEGKLTSLRNQLVSNFSLQRCGVACHLQHFIRMRAYQKKSYIPPGYLPEVREKSAEADRTKVMDSNKIIADVIEAIIGAYYLDSGRWAILPSSISSHLSVSLLLLLTLQVFGAVLARCLPSSEYSPRPHLFQHTISSMGRSPSEPSRSPSLRTNFCLNHRGDDRLSVHRPSSLDRGIHSPLSFSPLLLASSRRLLFLSTTRVPWRCSFGISCDRIPLRLVARVESWRHV